jgi:hypothetical protein
MSRGLTEQLPAARLVPAVHSNGVLPAIYGSVAPDKAGTARKPIE